MDVDPPSPIHQFANLDPDPIPSPEPATPPPPAPPPLTATGRPRRDYRLPRRFQDILPGPPVPAPLPEDPAPQTGSVRRVLLIVRDQLVTAANSFGIWRDYPRRPTIDPEGSLSLEELSNRGPTSLSATGDDHPPDSELPSELSEPDTLSEADRPFFWPFPNPTIWRVMSWLNNGSTAKSEAEVTVFVPKVILSPDFSKDHLIGFDAHRENQHLDKALSKFALQSQLQESPVEILVPSGDTTVPAQKFTVPGLLH